MRLNLNHTLLPALAVLFTALVATGGLFSLSGDSGNELTGDSAFSNALRKTTAESFERKERRYAQVITYACEDRNPTKCEEFPTARLPAGWSKQPRPLSQDRESSETQSIETPASSEKDIASEQTETPLLDVVKSNKNKCIPVALKGVRRPCVKGKRVDQYGCYPCNQKPIRLVR